MRFPAFNGNVLQPENPRITGLARSLAASCWDMRKKRVGAGRRI